MALPQVISRNLAQVANSNVLVNASSTIIGTTAVTLYTVPAGKVAMINSLITRISGMGANTAISLTVEGNIVKRVTASETTSVESAGGGIRLVATDVISFSGDSGSDNGAAGWLISIKEFDA